MKRIRIVIESDALPDEQAEALATSYVAAMREGSRLAERLSGVRSVWTVRDPELEDDFSAGS